MNNALIKEPAKRSLSEVLSGTPQDGSEPSNMYQIEKIMQLVMQGTVWQCS